MNKAPKNIFVFIIAKISNPFEIFFAKICVMLKTVTTNIIIISIENIPVDDVMIKNQKDNPAVTARDLIVSIIYSKFRSIYAIFFDVLVIIKNYFIL